MTYPGNVTYTRPALTRPEALEIANALVTEWAGQVKNERGYAHDKWQPVDLTQRTEAVLRVAAWLLEPTGPVPSGLLVPPVEHVHNGSTGHADYCDCGSWWNAKVSRWETRDGS